MGISIRWLFTYGSTPVHDSLRLPACTDEGRAVYVAILSPALSSHPSTVFHIHATVQHSTHVVGTDRRRNIYEGLVADIPEFPDASRTFVVYVSSDKPLLVYPNYIPWLRKATAKKNVSLSGCSCCQPVCLISTVGAVKCGDNVSGMNTTCCGTSPVIWAILFWHITFVYTLPGTVPNVSL